MLGKFIWDLVAYEISWVLLQYFLSTPTIKVSTTNTEIVPRLLIMFNEVCQ